MSLITLDGRPRTDDEFHRLVRRSQEPVVIRGAVSDEALQAHSPEAIECLYGDLDVPLLVEEELTGANEAIHETYETMKLKSFLEALRNGTATGYLAQCPMDVTFRDLMHGDVFPRFYLNKRRRRANLWIGPSGTRSKLHFDRDENVFCQLHGQKRFHFISPKHTRDLYPTNIGWGDGYSQVDLESPDLERYPHFSGVPIDEVTVEPGDMLYVPSGWWHDVESLTVSISYSLLWWPLPLWVQTQTWRWFSRLTNRLQNKPNVEYGPPPINGVRPPV